MNVNWHAIFADTVALLEKRFGLRLLIDSDIVAEIEHEYTTSLKGLSMSTTPNIAKHAGHITFWIRKLKPVSHSDKTAHKLLVVNELLAILVGASICAQYFDDTSSPNGFRFPVRILFDWTGSLRNNSYSPHSCAIAFEMLASEC